MNEVYPGGFISNLDEVNTQNLLRKDLTITRFFRRTKKYFLFRSHIFIIMNMNGEIINSKSDF